MSEIALAIGLVFLMEGFAYALFPQQMKRIMRVALEQPDQSMRTVGLIAATIGVAVVWLFKP